MPIILTVPNSLAPGSSSVDLVPILGRTDETLNRHTTIDHLVMASLYSWARAEEGDVLPSSSDGKRDRNGWFAERLSSRYESDRFGSRLWLLARAKATAETLRLAQSYAEEALAWLVEDGIAELVEVQATRTGASAYGLIVRITRGDGTLTELRYPELWREVG